MNLLTWSLVLIPIWTVIVLLLKGNAWLKELSNGFFKPAKFRAYFELWLTPTVILIVLDLASQLLIQ